jgi:hypothetical protein
MQGGSGGIWCAFLIPELSRNARLDRPIISEETVTRTHSVGNWVNDLGYCGDERNLSGIEPL